MKRNKRFFGCFLTLVLALIFASGFLGAGKSQQASQPAFATTYETDSSYVMGLRNDNSELESAYNLADYYPISAENQTESPFCWIYSSLKSLETSLMVQRGEYYNFSEVAEAYLDYTYRRSLSAVAAFEIAGNFDNFATIYQREGLVLESDVSNDLYNEITESNYLDYDYISNYATHELEAVVRPYNLCSNSAFVGLSLEGKQNVVKRFIKQYGALFAGIEGTSTYGWFYDNFGAYGNTLQIKSFYTYDISRISSNTFLYDTRKALGGDHAITIVGWCDSVYNECEQSYGAFLAMNSWGLESASREFFYIPYDYTTIYSNFAGFICDDYDTEDVSIDSASSSSFTTNILTGSGELKNFFCYDDTISVTYKLNVSSLGKLKVKASSGGKDYTSYFSTDKNNEQKTVNVTLSAPAGKFYGGYYTFDFYNNGEHVGKKSLFIYSATEIGYFKTFYNGGYGEYSLDNTFLSSGNSSTMLFSDSQTAYFLRFNKARFSKYMTLASSNKSASLTGTSLEISDITVTCTTDTSKETAYTADYIKGNFFIIHQTNSQNSGDDDTNQFTIQMGVSNGINLTAFRYCLLSFKLTMGSTLYTNCEREYYFNVFFSPRTTASTEDLIKVNYNLDGGENSGRNVTKMPDYTKEPIDSGTHKSCMTEVPLYAPTKAESNFMGWYLSDSFEGSAITGFDENSTLEVFARWEDTSVNYFDIDLSIFSVCDYNDVAKAIDADLIYGDSIVLRFTFDEKAALSSYDYTVMYYLYGLEDSCVSGYISTGETHVDFDFEFPNLTSGVHNLRLDVEVEIAGLLTHEKTQNLAISVAKKQVNFTFSDLNVVYNGQNQQPTVQKIGFYDEDINGKTDAQIFVLACAQEQSRNVGSYNFYISSLILDDYDFVAENTTCQLQVTPKQISIEWNEYSQVYDGRNHFPTFTVNDIILPDVVEFSFIVNGNPATSSSCVAAGNYIVNIDPSTISNANYVASEAENFEFTIQKANIRIILHDTTDRLQTPIGNRTTPDFDIEGSIYSRDDVGVRVISEAFNATKSGTFDISCLYNDSNYYCSPENLVKATYTITGYYFVYYQLQNGTHYAEKVEEGKQPVGVTKEQMKLPLFSRIKYSKEFDVTGNDLYVAVTVEDYSAQVYAGIFVGLFLAVCAIFYFKNRGSKVR